MDGKRLVYQKLPAPNKYLETVEADRLHKEHKKRMASIKAREPGSSTVDNTTPATMHLPHLAHNRKREQLAKDRAMEMERDNRRILSKVAGVRGSFPKEFYRHTPAPVSMNLSRRKAEVERINRENARMLARLTAWLNTGSMSQDLKPPVTLNMGSVKHKLPTRRPASSLCGKPPGAASLATTSVPSLPSRAPTRGSTSALAAAGLDTGETTSKLLSQLTQGRSVLDRRRPATVGAAAGSRADATDAGATDAGAAAATAARGGVGDGGPADAMDTTLTSTTSSAPDLSSPGTAPATNTKRRRKKRPKRGARRSKLDLTHHPYTASVDELAAAAGAIPARRRSISPLPAGRGVHARARTKPVRPVVQPPALPPPAVPASATAAARVPSPPSPGAQAAAATTIQCAARRRAARRRVAEARQQRDAAVRIQSVARRRAASRRVSALQQQQRDAAVRIQSVARRRAASKRVAELRAGRDLDALAADPDANAAATRIQAVQRRRAASKRVAAMRRGPPRSPHRAAMARSQAAAYGGGAGLEDQEATAAAVRIQSAARRRRATRRVNSLRRKRAGAGSGFGVGAGLAADGADVGGRLGATVLATVTRTMHQEPVDVVVTYDSASDGMTARATLLGAPATVSMPASAVAESVSPAVIVLAAFAAGAVSPAADGAHPWLPGVPALTPQLKAALLAHGVTPAPSSTPSPPATPCPTTPSRPSAGLTYAPATVRSSKRVVRVSGELLYCRCSVVPSSARGPELPLASGGTDRHTVRAAVLTFTRRWDGATGSLVVPPPALHALGLPSDALPSPSQVLDAALPLAACVTTGGGGFQVSLSDA